jgi:putative Mg2+ transporter-C (MgtC) family protein
MLASTATNFNADISVWEMTLRLAVAALAGGVIGIERQSRHREAGLRTHMLVSIGACLFTLVSAYAWTDWTFANGSRITFDPTRISAQIVSGIGFLGAGAIIRHGASVRGLTTAATLWACAALGMAAGAGFYWAGALATAFMLISLVPMRLLSRRFEFLRPTHTQPLLVTLTKATTPTAVMKAIEDHGASVEKFQLKRSDDRTRLTMDVALREEVTPGDVAEALADIDGVLDLEWISG